MLKNIEYAQICILFVEAYWALYFSPWVGFGIGRLIASFFRSENFIGIINNRVKGILLIGCPIAFSVLPMFPMMHYEVNPIEGYLEALSTGWPLFCILLVISFSVGLIYGRRHQ